MSDVIKVTLPEEGEFQPGQPIEVPLESVVLPESVKTLDEVRKEYVPKTNVQQDIKTRLQQQAVNLRNELAQDEEFARDILISKGVPLTEEGEIDWPESHGISAEDVQQRVKDGIELQKLQWERKHLEPLSAERDSALQEIELLRTKILHSEIMEAARKAGVLEEKFEVLPGAPSSTAPVIQQTAHKFGYDSETKTWALKAGENQYQISTHDNPERPYAGPDEYFEMLKEDTKVREKWFKDDRPSSPDPGRPASSGNKQPHEVSDDERRKQLMQMNNTFANR